MCVGEETEPEWLIIDILLTAPATPSSATEETATQKEQWFVNGWHGEYTQTPKEDSHSTAGTAGNGWFHSKLGWKLPFGLNAEHGGH